MKIFCIALLGFVLFIYAPSVFSQTDNHPQDTVLIIVEQMPAFPGGEEALYKFLSTNIKYPTVAKETGISGTVVISFIVEKNGEISNARVIKGIGGGCDDEALRVIKSMPNWSPGKQLGKPVRVQFNLPVKFSLT
jgi:periplasmic protein TonB